MTSKILHAPPRHTLALMRSLSYSFLLAIALLSDCIAQRQRGR